MKMNRSEKQQYFLRNLSGNVTCNNFGEEVENISVNQRPGQPS
jgi:hypothetical protein